MTRFRRVLHPVRHTWRGVRWLVILGLAVAAFVLGAIGFEQPHGISTTGSSFSNALYQSLQLFSMNSGFAGPGPVPLSLQIARFLAPLVAGWAVFAALTALFREQVQLLKVRYFSRNHTIIAGLGTMGSLLARRFAESGAPVVVIELNPGPVDWPGGRGLGVGELRDQGVPVIVGDAGDPDVLRKARLGRARHLIVTCGDDSANIDVLAAAEECGPRGDQLETVVHLDEIELWRFMEAAALARRGIGGLQPQFFNVFDVAAHLLVDAHPPFAIPPDAPAPHLLFAGLDGVGASLLVTIAGAWRRRVGDDGSPLQVTLTGAQADESFGSLVGRYSDLPDIADVRMPGRQVGESHESPITAAFVSIIPAASGLATALALRRTHVVGEAPIVVAVGNEDGGVGRAIATGYGAASEVDVFGVFSRTCSPDLIFNLTREIIARAKHEHYLRGELARGEELGSKDTLAPWSALSADNRDANRRAAERIADIPRLLPGVALVPNALAYVGDDEFFLAHETEVLAQIEHEGWCDEKLSSGWRWGPTYDPEQRLHPSLVAWQELGDVDRQRDRDAVEAVPGVLAEAGFELIRTSEGRPVLGDLAETPLGH
jgi:TrkA-N domain/RyR domain